MTCSLDIREKVPNKEPSLGSGVRQRWWANFTQTIREEHFGPGFKFFQEDWIAHRTAMLSKYNAHYDGNSVHFATKQDAAFFILRWS